MNTLIRKELRENFKVALIGLALFTFILVQITAVASRCMPGWPWVRATGITTMRNPCCHDR